LGSSISQLVSAAEGGDREAWDALVERFAGLVWSITRAHNLPRAEAADAVQTTWLRLVENLDRIQDPERLGAWLATTAKRECLRSIRLGARELPTADEWALDTPVVEPLDRDLLVSERDSALATAFAKLGERCRALLRLLSAPEPPSYEEVSAALGMPIGAIGPTRARCLQKLRGHLELSGFDPA